MTVDLYSAIEVLYNNVFNSLHLFFLTWSGIVHELQLYNSDSICSHTNVTCKYGYKSKQHRFNFHETFLLNKYICSYLCITLKYKIEQMILNSLDSV